MEYTYDDLEMGENQIDGFTVKIEQDDTEGDGPRDWDNIGTMVCWHPNYNLGDKQISAGFIADHLIGLLGDALEFEHQPTERENLETAIEELEEGEAGRDVLDAMLAKYYVILPLILYDHSGLSMSTTREMYPFNCPWDAGQVGFIYAHKSKLDELLPSKPLTPKRDYKILEDALVCEVTVYDQYLRGDVYFYTIEDADGEHLDSCGGFYGYDYVRDQAVEALNACIEEQRKDHVEDVKTWIKHKVPLHVRQELSQA